MEDDGSGGNDGDDWREDCREVADAAINLADGDRGEEGEEEEEGEEGGEGEEGEEGEEDGVGETGFSKTERINQWKRRRPSRVKALAWTLGAGFKIYTQGRAPQIAVCETCVKDGDLLKAEVNYGKSKSPTMLRQHLRTNHPDLHIELLRQLLQAKEAGKF